MNGDDFVFSVCDSFCGNDQMLYNCEYASFRLIGQCKTVTLKRGADGLGFSIVGGYGSLHGDLPIYVKNVFDTGTAAVDGTLHHGDQILSVNGLSLDGISHDEAVDILKNARGEVTLTVLS